MTKAIWLQ